MAVPRRQPGAPPGAAAAPGPSAPLSHPCLTRGGGQQQRGVVLGLGGEHVCLLQHRLDGAQVTVVAHLLQVIAALRREKGPGAREAGPGRDKAAMLKSRLVLASA